MNQLRWSLAVAALVLAAADARAERPQALTIDVPVLTPKAGTISSRLIYMRRCPPVGCVVRAGNDDSRTDTSMIADGQRTIGAFTQSDAVWQQVMSCVRATYAPFNIGVTDVDPGLTPHYEHIVGGRPTDLRGDIGGAGGVSPFTCDEIPNAITYTFDVYGPDADSLCWTAAQETAHAFGLEHEYNAADPMTYLPGPLPKRFQAADSPCGTFQAATCQCTGGATQSSYMRILDLFGPGAPTPPTVEIRSPTSGQKVQPHFTVKVRATDDVAIDRVELWIDGENTNVSSQAPPQYPVSAPDLPQGAHSVEVRAYDVQGTPASATIDVMLGPPCTASNGCSGADVCVMGQCVPGPDVPGGLGSFCQANTECLSQQCVSDSTGHMACVEPCEVRAGTCPENFSCIQGGEAGVCWQTGQAGCCDAGGQPTGPLLLGLGVVALVLRRRRP
jgi:hypothetical protein